MQPYCFLWVFLRNYANSFYVSQMMNWKLVKETRRITWSDYPWSVSWRNNSRMAFSIASRKKKKQGNLRLFLSKEHYHNRPYSNALNNCFVWLLSPKSIFHTSVISNIFVIWRNPSLFRWHVSLDFPISKLNTHTLMVGGTCLVRYSGTANGWWMTFVLLFRYKWFVASLSQVFFTLNLLFLNFPLCISFIYQ